QGDRETAARCAGYLLLFGLMIAAKIPFSRDRRWFVPLLREILTIPAAAVRHSFFFSVAGAFLTSLRNRREQGARMLCAPAPSAGSR
ncbi:MAG TPA: hypothetical protein VNX25_06285, partial [Verrucomicrobiae bacterium]|nr:hypothetical protein [Verrucomicrobiae bacterium]